MGELAAIDATGDTKTMWDKSKPAEVDAARAQYNKLRGDGYAAFKAVGDKGSKGEQIFDFNPEHERIIMVPPMAGG